MASPANHSTVANPVRLSAIASGSHAVSQIQLWVNAKKILQVNGGILFGTAWLPAGKNERLGIHAIDKNSGVAKVVQTVTIQ